MPATSATDRKRGKVIEWNAAKAYGFVDDGRQRVFIHIRDFAERHKTPEPGDVLHYGIGADSQGRTCAKNIVQANDGGRLRARHFVSLALLLVVPAYAIWRLAPPRMGIWSAGWIVATSAICYRFYAWDKRRAREGAWRLPERMLHFWEIIGGWPGGFLAQRRLRHKSSKPGYLFAFWLIVMAHNYTALDWILEWRMSRGAATTVRSWLKESTAQKSRVY